jgi:hypothetical protein
MANRLADLPQPSGWGTYGTRPKDLLREIKRAEAEERNAHTLPERRRTARRAGA